MYLTLDISLWFAERINSGGREQDTGASDGQAIAPAREDPVLRPEDLRPTAPLLHHHQAGPKQDEQLLRRAHRLHGQR